MKAKLGSNEDGEIGYLLFPDEPGYGWGGTELDIPDDLAGAFKAAAAAYDTAITALRTWVESIPPEGKATSDDWYDFHVADNLSEEEYRARVAGCDHPTLSRWSMENGKRSYPNDGNTRGICATCATLVSPTPLEGS